MAVEQAEESVPLQDFVFPPKTLLLLGKEREGVPVELLNKVQLTTIDLSSTNSNANLRWMIVWRSLRVGWSVPSTSMSLVPSSSGRRSSSCPSCRRRLDVVVFRRLGPCRFLVHTFTRSLDMYKAAKPNVVTLLLAFVQVHSFRISAYEEGKLFRN